MEEEAGEETDGDGGRTVVLNVDYTMDVEALVPSSVANLAGKGLDRTYLTSLAVAVLISFEKQYVYRPSFSAVRDAVPSDSLSRLLTAMFIGSDNYNKQP